LPGSRIPLLLLPAVPHTVTHAALVDLLGEAAFDVRHIRIVRGENDTAGDVYMALLRFNTLASADRWRAAVHGKPFSGKDGPRISALYVARVSLVRRGARLFPHDGAVELPRCVICLERMDSSVTGVMTTQCSHTFHCSCLARWADVQEQQLHDKRSRAIDLSSGWQIVGGKHSTAAAAAAAAAAVVAPDPSEKRNRAPARGIASSCPVCRFAQRDAKVASSNSCSVEGCDVSESLWTCLVCATVNCGRAANKHALAHFHESGHAFSLEIATGRIWSYVGDAYVHRLMHAGVESVAQEPPAAAAATADSGASAGGNSTTTPSIIKPTKAAADEMDEVFDKDDAMEAEYTYLLTSQLAAQRRHFEQSMHAAERQAQKQVDQLFDENERMRLSVARLERKLESTERALAQKEHAFVAAEEAAAKRLAQVQAEKAVVDRLVQQSRDSSRSATSSLRETQSQLATAQARLKELEEELHDMRFALTMSEKVNTNEELQGAQIAGVAPKVKKLPRRR
jgi:BRCA1-associated protein